MSVYGDYTRGRIGWFFGLTGLQLAVLSVAVLPVAWSVSAQDWLAAALFVVLWGLLFLVLAVPVRGRPMTGWIGATLRLAAGTLAGWTRFRARATRGQPSEAGHADLPGILSSIVIHEGPPTGHHSARVALIQNHSTRTWAVTASIVHPGLGMTELEDRAAYGSGLTELLDAAVRAELVTEIIFMVRTVPEDGAERLDWVRRHRAANAPAQVSGINDELHESLTAATVRTEQYVTVVVPEARLAKVAREYGGGINGRARALYGAITEIESHLRAGMGVTSVQWLTSPELAHACRTGFAPGDRASLIDALAAARTDAGVNADVPWEMAGPSGADASARHYSHDAWNSVSSTIKLPIKGAAMGALAPVLSAHQDGERRSFMVCYPLVASSRADRSSANSEFGADLGQSLRVAARMKQRTKNVDESEKVRRLEAKLARGNSMTVPYAVATVTVPKTVAAAEAGRRLDSSIRRAGFAPLRLDLAHDVAFAASVVPMGVSLTRKAV
ncbi:SCO6880 family protein [Ornithinimicrobium cryptoxanthini]|uniref:PrgI family protein n=1 Tax=Ornithinimicrobium cryptoxanthini TaxID=2934161 RepID=A0ABY4YMH4_9MICO|nr:SCO6880 family protein [Ornithinimicrobium cryptoxanthini]USQ77794.1 PrgI family protein [Ornithinimicrobium cryptoxanthini]